MRHRYVGVLAAVGVTACASLSPNGARVKVYEANFAAPESARTLPAGCRILSTTAPESQMESERHISDPYRTQRNDTAAQGGNVLLVLSDRFRSFAKTDCATSENSPDCQSQNWYKVRFASYACDAAAEQTLAAKAAEAADSTSSEGWWLFGSKKTKTTPAPASAAAPAPAPAVDPAVAPRGEVSPSELEAKILRLMREGVGTDVLVAYAKSHRVSSALTAEEILDWKKAGIAEPVIEAAIAAVRSTP